MLPIRILEQPNVKRSYWSNNALEQGRIYGDFDDRFAKVQLAVPKLGSTVNAEYYILCTLHTLSTNGMTHDQKLLPLSVHYMDKNSDDNVGKYKNIIDKMKLQKSMNNSKFFYTYDLDDHRIHLVHSNAKFERSLSERKSQLLEMNLEFQEDVEETNKNETKVIKYNANIIS